MTTSIRFALLLTTAALAACTAPTQTQDLASTDVRIETPDRDVTLAGTLLTPRGADTAVLFVTGTGNHVRDQMISGHPMFKTIAESVAEVGIASLRTDVRGAGESTGPKATDSTTTERVVDMAAALAWLRDQGFAEVGVIGHSAGAAIAAELAASDAPPDFVVLLGAPALKGIDVWVAQQAAWAAGQPIYDDVVAVLTRAAEKSIAGADADAMRADAVELFRLAELEHDPDIESMVENFVTRMSETVMRDFLAGNPGPALARTRAPTLVVYGAADQLTSVAQNAPPLVDALAAAGNDDFQLVVIPEQDHFFLRQPGKPVGEHAFGKMEMSSELLAVINRWLSRHEGAHAPR